MKKNRIGRLLMCVLLIAMTAACAQTEPAEPSQTQTQPAQTTAVTAARAEDADMASPQTSRADDAQTPSRTDGTQTTQQSASAPTQTGRYGPLFQQFIRDLVDDGDYTVSMRQTGITIVTAVSGGDSAVDSDMAGVLHITLIHRGDKYYMLMHGTKKYAEMTEDAYEDQVKSLESAALELQNVQLLETGEQTVAGKRYRTETYDEGEHGTVTYYFTDTGLARAEVLRNGKTTALESFTVRDAADADLFEIPAGFTLVEDPAQLMT